LFLLFTELIYDDFHDMNIFIVINFENKRSYLDTFILLIEKKSQK